jgi:transcriptional regulator with XRE-family HTH domain
MNHVAVLTPARSGRTIDEIRDIFGLSETGFARLFRVSRQAIEKWRRNGVPPARTADLDRVLEIARVFRERLLEARIPQIVRTPALGLGSRTVLDVLEKEGTEPVYRYLHRLYSYAGA